MRAREAEARALAKPMRRALTKAEAVLWDRLKGRRLAGLHIRRQHPIGPFVADFACTAARLVIEVDGATHMTEAERAHDASRTVFLEREGWHVIRIWNAEIYDDRDGVLRRILDVASARIGAAPSTALRAVPLPR